MILVYGYPDSKWVWKEEEGRVTVVCGYPGSKWVWTLRFCLKFSVCNKPLCGAAASMLTLFFLPGG